MHAGMILMQLAVHLVVWCGLQLAVCPQCAAHACWYDPDAACCPFVVLLYNVPDEVSCKSCWPANADNGVTVLQ